MKSTGVLILVSLLAGCSNEPVKPAPAVAPLGSASAPAPATPADEEAALRIVVEINQAQKRYIDRNRRYALTFEELVIARYLPEEPSTAKTGYEFKLRPTADAGSYTLFASPVTGGPAARHFFSDKSGKVRSETGKEASEASPEIPDSAKGK